MFLIQFQNSFRPLQFSDFIWKGPLWLLFYASTSHHLNVSIIHRIISLQTRIIIIIVNYVYFYHSVVSSVDFATSSYVRSNWIHFGANKFDKKSNWRDLVLILLLHLNMNMNMVLVFNFLFMLRAFWLVSACSDKKKFSLRKYPVKKFMRILGQKKIQNSRETILKKWGWVCVCLILCNFLF